MSVSLPIVDLGGLAEAAETADVTKLRAVADAFDSACRTYGFCYISNHGVPDAVRAEAFAMNAAFHARPLAEKKAIAINKAHRGYMAMASSVIVTSSIEKATKPNQSESFMLMHEVAPGKETFALDGSNQWPAEPSAFRPAISAYDAALRALAQQMTRMIAVALGLQPRELDRYFERATTFLRLLHYPPSPPDADSNLYGSAPHTDYGFITILAQDRAGGLQVRNVGGEWIDATPIDGTFVVNIGDIGSRWTNGRWRSTPHRVINRSGTDRYSMPYFYDPAADVVVECLPTCCSAAEPARYPPVNYGRYLMERIDANYSYRAKAGA